MEESAVAAMEVLLLPDADPTDVAVASEAVIAWAHSHQLEALHKITREQPGFVDPTGEVVDPAPAEVATTLHWSTGAAARRLDLAETICTELPSLLDALRHGRVDLAKADEIASGTCELEPDDRQALVADAIDYAGTHTRTQLRAWLARRVAAIDPEAVQRRRRRAIRSRRVWVDPERDGMATLGAYLTAEEAQACWNALRSAGANIEGGVDAARADAFVALITGTAIGEPVPVQVILTPGGPELAGHGPLSPSHATELCERGQRIDLRPPRPSVGYRPAVGMRRWIHARDRHCRFPGCRRPAVVCDIDHVVPYPRGATCESNLAALCRYHHRLKTHTSWAVRMLPGAVLRWTSPTGHEFHTTLNDP